MGFTFKVEHTAYPQRDTSSVHRLLGGNWWGGVNHLVASWWRCLGCHGAFEKWSPFLLEEVRHWGWAVSVYSLTPLATACVQLAYGRVSCQPPAPDAGACHHHHQELLTLWNCRLKQALPWSWRFSTATEK